MIKYLIDEKTYIVNDEISNKRIYVVNNKILSKKIYTMIIKCLVDTRICALMI